MLDPRHMTRAEKEAYIASLPTLNAVIRFPEAVCPECENLVSGECSVCVPRCGVCRKPLKRADIGPECGGRNRADWDKKNGEWCESCREWNGFGYVDRM